MESSSQQKPCITDPPSVCAIDRISLLPDEILHYILSFVDIIDVVRSSVLSRRWKPLWTTMPYLNFDCDAFSHQYRGRRLLRTDSTVSENFQELINWVLLSQSSTNITRFRLRCYPMFCLQQIHRWIQVAKRRNVQELELDIDPSLYAEGVFELPSFESLRVLKFSYSGYVLDMPSHLKFNQLTSLHLEDVEFIDEDLTRRLFSECSFLEELVLNNCVTREMEVIDISSSCLKRLTLMEEISAFGQSQIRISCPNLISFTYMAAASKNFYLSNLPSLNEICIDIFFEEEWSNEESGHLACNILKQVENISVLKLYVRAMWFLSAGIKELQSFSKTFCKLKSLNLSIEIIEDHTRVMFLLLKYCPNIKSLHLYCESDFSGDVSTQCSRSYDEKRQLRFAKFMLKNGLVLENFVITLSEDVEYSLSTVQKLLRLLQ